MIGNSLCEVDDLHAPLIIDELKKISITGCDKGWSPLFDAKCGHDVIGFVIIDTEHRNSKSFKNIKQNWNLSTVGVGFLFFPALIDSISLITWKEIDAPAWSPIALKTSN